MGLRVRPPEPSRLYPSVGLSRTDACVPQQLLNHPDVNAIAKQQRRHCMPEHVRNNVTFDAGVPTKLRDDISHPLRRKPFTGSIQKQSQTLRYQS